MTDHGISCNLSHRRNVATLSMLFKILERPDHPIGSYMPAPNVARHHTRYAAGRHSRVLDSVRSRTNQFSRSFIPASVALWNSLTDEVFAGGDVHDLKSKVNKFLSA